MGLFSSLFNRPPKPGRPEPVFADSFQSDVLESPLPVVVDFWSATCAPCQVMGGLLNEIGPSLAGRLRILKLNISDAPEIAMQFGVQSVPTLIAFSQGQIVDRIVGLLPLQPLQDRLEQIAKRHAQPNT